MSKPRMPLPGPLQEGVFLARPNRFLSKVKLNGHEVWSHVPDPGRLKELLIPGARVLLQEHAGSGRKTRFSTVMVYHGDQLVSINSQLPNRFARFCFDHQLIPEWLGWQVVRPEVKMGESRFDFLLSNGRREKVVEVKSVTLVEDGVARFPDAVTARGARHVRHLAELITDERSTAVLFLVQRPDARAFQPKWDRDPVFGQALLDAVARGVEILVYSSHLTDRWMSLEKRLPIDLEPPA